MNKKFLITAGLCMIAATTMFASEWQQREYMNQREEFTCKHNMHERGFMQDLRQLNLGNDQKQQIRLIMKEQMQKMPHLSDAFSENGFDKALFIKLEQQKRDQMIQNRADMIEKIYRILTDAQKQQFRIMLQKHKEPKTDKENN